MDGAKINGKTYVDELFILQQRSDSIYDLIGSDGEIFPFVPVTWKTESGENLDYYTESTELVETIKDNTFFWKVQDPRENIYGFMTMIHTHKIKVHTGKYIYKTEYQDFSLQSVHLTPSMIYAKVGDIIEIDIEFNPPNIANKKGNWILTNSNIVRQLPDLSTSTKQCYECLYEGSAYAVFVPDMNKNISSSSTVIVSQVEPPVPEYENYMLYLDSYHPTTKAYYNNGIYYPGDILTISAVTEPYNVKLPENLTSTMELFGPVLDDDIIVQLDTSDDPNVYKFKIRDELPVVTGNNTTWTARIKLSGLDKSYNFEITIKDYLKPTTRPLIYGRFVYGVGNPQRIVSYDTKPKYGVAWVSEDITIATVDKDGMVSPLKEGATRILCYHANEDGTPNLTSTAAISSITVKDNIPTAIHYFPNDKFTYEVGEEIQFSYELVPSGSVLPHGDSWRAFRADSSQYVTISETGLAKVIEPFYYNDEPYFNATIFTAMNSQDYIDASRNDNGAGKFCIGVVPKGTVIKPTGFNVNNITGAETTEEYTVLPEGGDPIEFTVGMLPTLTTGDKSAIVEVDDTSVARVEYDPIGMNNYDSFQVFVYPLKKGKVTLTVTSVQDPTVKYTRLLYVV